MYTHVYDYYMQWMNDQCASLCNYVRARRQLCNYAACYNIYYVSKVHRDGDIMLSIPTTGYFFIKNCSFKAKT